MTDFIQDVARCTWPYHLSRPLRRTAVISLIPSFWSSEAEVVSTRSLVPQIQWIMALSLQRSFISYEMFGSHVSLPWCRADWTQAVYTLSRTLVKRCLEVRTGSNFVNFRQAPHHLAQSQSTMARALGRELPLHLGQM